MLISIWEFVWPFSLLVGEGFLEAVEDHLVGCFDSPVALRISWRGHVLLNVILLEELHQIFVRELRAVVGDDELRDDKLANDVPPYEAFYVCLSRGRHGLCFYPFGEVVGCHDHHVFAPSSRRHRSYQVDYPLHEWSRTRLWV
ncbi:hypothetical protein ACFX1S_045639 [Malus domestica]